MAQQEAGYRETRLCLFFQTHTTHKHGDGPVYRGMSWSFMETGKKHVQKRLASAGGGSRGRYLRRYALLYLNHTYYFITVHPRPDLIPHRATIRGKIRGKLAVSFSSASLFFLFFHRICSPSHEGCIHQRCLIIHGRKASPHKLHFLQSVSCLDPLSFA